MSAVFLKILNMSIAAGWLILAAVFLRLLLRKAPRKIVCLFWGLAGLRLVLPVSIRSLFSLIPSRDTVPADIALSPAPAIDSGIPAVNSAVNPIIGSFAPDPQTVASVNPLQVIIPAAAIIWLAGACAMLLYALISYLKMRRTVAAAVPAGGRVYACDEVDSPFILGVFRPRIYIPSAMEGETLAAVLAHEEMHLKRRDHVWKPLAFLLLSVYWFNPLCWLAFILLSRDLEAACDEAVIRGMDRESLAAYSQALLDCSCPRRRIAACPLAFGEVGVKGRVKNVLNYKKPAFWLIIIAVLACIVLTVCFLTDPKKKEEPEMTKTTFTAEISRIDGNVMYVIPAAGSNEARSSNLFEVTLKAPEDSAAKAEAGDTVLIEYDGIILEVCPARLNKIYSMKLLKTLPEMERLKALYPQYFGLRTGKGLEVWIWQLAAGSYRCGLLPGTNREKNAEDLVGMLGGCSMDEMRTILSTYDVPEENIIVIPWRNPLSSYYWPDFDFESEAKRLRGMLFAEEPDPEFKTGSYVKIADGADPMMMPRVFFPNAADWHTTGAAWMSFGLGGKYTRSGDRIKALIKKGLYQAVDEERYLEFEILPEDRIRLVKISEKFFESMEKWYEEGDVFALQKE